MDLAVGHYKMTAALLWVRMILARIEKGWREGRRLEITIELPGYWASCVEHMATVATWTVKYPTFYGAAG